MTAVAPAHTSRSRRIAISAGALAVLLGALDTYVVVTIIRDIMSDVGIAINQKIDAPGLPNLHSGTMAIIL